MKHSLIPLTYRANCRPRLRRKFHQKLLRKLHLFPRLTAMSATISKDEFLQYLSKTRGDSRRIFVVFRTRLHPLAENFLVPNPAVESRTKTVIKAVLLACREYPPKPGPGNAVLVFLPGRKDIDTVEALFSRFGPHRFHHQELKYLIHPKRALGGQDTIKMSDFDLPSTGRNVSLATTAAETNITIDDVGIVINSGATNVHCCDHTTRSIHLTAMRSITPLLLSSPRAPSVGFSTVSGIFCIKL
jgi:HrpA-like RNA helicase